MDIKNRFYPEIEIEIKNINYKSYSINQDKKKDILHILKIIRIWLNTNT